MKSEFFFHSLISGVQSEMKMSQNRDREWKVNWKCLEIEKWNFSRIFENFLRIKKIFIFCYKCFSFNKLLLWNPTKKFIIITLTRIVFKKRISIMKLLHFCVIHDQFFWIFHDKTCIIHSFFSRKRVKSEMLSLFSRNEKWICFSFHSFREWKVKWKCLEIEIESEKWNENASRSRSRSEIGKKFSRILEIRDSRRVLPGGTSFLVI